MPTWHLKLKTAFAQILCFVSGVGDLYVVLDCELENFEALPLADSPRYNGHFLFVLYLGSVFDVPDNDFFVAEPVHAPHRSWRSVARPRKRAPCDFVLAQLGMDASRLAPFALEFALGPPLLAEKRWLLLLYFFLMARSSSFVLILVTLVTLMALPAFLFSVFIPLPPDMASSLCIRRLGTHACQSRLFW